MQEVSSLWLPLLAALLLGFILGRMTAKSPIQRDRERKEHEAALRRYKSQIEPETLAKVRDLLRQNRKIEAIKLVRERMSIGLKEAKDLVEGL